MVFSRGSSLVNLLLWRQTACTILIKQCSGPTCATYRVYLGTSRTGAKRLSTRTRTSTKNYTINTVRRNAAERPDTISLNFDITGRKNSVTLQTARKRFVGRTLQSIYVRMK